MQPNTYEDWLVVSRERQEDARALLPSRKTSVGPVYIAGYAVEASLKAFLRRLNKSIPKRGEEGHNLKGLWKQAGFSLRDIKDESGEKSFFVEDWNTALRYETSLEQVNIPDSESLVKAAGELAGWIRTQIRRKNRRRGKL